jgi:hypothetical protein
MTKLCTFTIPALLVGAAINIPAQVVAPSATRVVTASNTANNQLLVYDTSSNLIQTVATGGQGGVSGNSGGLTAFGNVVAVVNFLSNSVSIFGRR